MFFSIDPQNGMAIYDQIVRQIKFGIAEGILKPGQMLPSVRVLSQQLAINPNTINRAFQQLQQEQLIAPLRGVGLVVQDGAVAQCSEDRRTLLSDRLQSVLMEALHAGLSAKQIEQLVRQQLANLVGRVATVASAGAVESESARN